MPDARSEKNQRLLITYAGMIRGVGWGAILLFFVGAGSSIYGMRQGVKYGPYGELSASWPFAVEVVLYGCVTYVFPALLAFALAQFVEYLLGSQLRPKWALRNLHLILFAYGTLLLIVLALRGISLPSTEIVRKDPVIASSMFVLEMALPVFARVAMLFGAALICRRMLPVIEESKTLV